MKILFIGHYRENSGWGEITRRYIRCLSKVADVVVRPIILENNATLEEDILELEGKNQIGCTHCIQFVLPHFMVQDTRLKTVGLFMWETVNIPHIWKEYLESHDDIWVTNRKMSQDFGYNGKQPFTVPIPIGQYTKEKLNDVNLNDSYNFYFIGEVNARKNLETLIKCFHTEFSREENVNLVLKLNKPGENPTQVLENASRDIEQIKSGLRLYKNGLYKKEIIITEFLSRENLVRLHNSCDCFVSCSHGEGISLSMVDAVMLGNPCVVPAQTGEGYILQDYKKLSDNPLIGWDCRGQYSPCYKWHTLVEYANVRDIWVDVNQLDFMEGMRDFFSRGKIKHDGLIEHFTDEKIGHILMERLCKI